MKISLEKLTSEGKNLLIVISDNKKYDVLPHQQVTISNLSEFGILYESNIEPPNCDIPIDHFTHKY